MKAIASETKKPIDECVGLLLERRRDLPAQERAAIERTARAMIEMQKGTP